ncbi:MAG: protein kinase [Ignavibacteria bacterium]|nr:protein kinase [Ignavibacteria bacterium]
MIGTTISHYNIVEKLGEGGMGVVYKAEDTKLRRDVAIKFLPRHISVNKEDRQRFEIEAQAAAALNHPNIATIYSIEESGNEVFIVMEYINGIELKEKIKKGFLNLEESQNIIEQIAQGLKTAHQRGIIHRDIKSANIMITQSGLVKIMDFGLAKVGGTSQITKLGTTLGTTAYMSPEQARGEQVDSRTDIWSMGVIFYEMLTSKFPFKGEFDQAIIYSILNEEPESITSIRKDVSLKPEQIIMKMLSKDKDRRYQNISEILMDLNDLKNKSDEGDTGKKTIAVLPFENISPDKEADYFADGLAEELITNLSKIREIKLVARTNTMRYKGTDKDIKTLGRELGARYIMQGSVRKFKDDLRISVQLMDVSQESQLWGETYKGKLADIFDIQEQVSKQIADMLMVNLSPSEKIVLTKRSTVNAEAFDCYLRARDFLYRLTKNNIQFAIQLFNKAIETDKRYASAYAGLSEAYAYLYSYFERREDLLEKAIESGLRALMYDPSLSEAYAALAMAYYNKKLYDDAITSSQKAIELDPNNFLGYWILGRIYHNRDRDKEAIELFQKVITLNPDFYSAYGDLQIVYARLGENEKHQEIIQASIKVYERYLSQHPDDARGHIFYATALVMIGKKDEAKIQAAKALELSPDDPLMLYNACCFYSQMGEKKLAIESLKNAFSAGYANYDWLKRDTDLDPIRNEPEYIELMRGK